MLSDQRVISVLLIATVLALIANGAQLFQLKQTELLQMLDQDVRSEALLQSNIINRYINRRIYELNFLSRFIDTNDGSVANSFPLAITAFKTIKYINEMGKLKHQWRADGFDQARALDEGEYGKSARALSWLYLKNNRASFHLTASYDNKKDPINLYFSIPLASKKSIYAGVLIGVVAVHDFFKSIEKYEQSISQGPSMAVQVVDVRNALPLWQGGNKTPSFDEDIHGKSLFEHAFLLNNHNISTLSSNRLLRRHDLQNGFMAMFYAIDTGAVFYSALFSLPVLTTLLCLAFIALFVFLSGQYNQQIMAKLRRYYLQLVEQVSQGPIEEDYFFEHIEVESKRLLDEIREKNGKDTWYQMMEDTLLRTARCDVFEWDLDTEQLRFVQRWGSIIGLGESKRSISTEQWRKFIHPLDLDFVEQALRACIQGEKIKDACSYRIRHADGHYVSVSTCCKLYKDKNDVPRKLVGVNVDVTALRQLEEKLVRLTDTLSERTSDYEKKKSQLSKRLLLSLSQEKASAVITLIEQLLCFGTEEFLRIFKPKNEANVSSDLVEHFWKSQIGVIRDILALETNNLTMDTVSFDLEEVVAELRHLFNAFSGVKELSFNIELESDVPRLLIGDRRRLLQLLELIALYSIARTDKGFVAIFIQRLDDNPNNTSCCLQFLITDNGASSHQDTSVTLLNDEHKDIAFETRLINTWLHLCQKLVTELDASLIVSDNEGTGSTFVLTLNYPIEVFLGDPSRSKAVQEGIVTDDLKNLRVLVAEDSEINKHALSDMLGKYKINATFCQSGDEVIELARKEPFDVILMDIEMPVVGGIEAAQRIRQFSTYNNVPIIAVSAHSNAEIKRDCLHAGMNGYLKKPVDETELKSTLAMWSGVSDNGDRETSDEQAAKPEQHALNTEKALTVLMGSKETYINLLEIFVNKFDDLQRIPVTDLIAANNLDANRRRIHTIKSSASYIGAEELHSLAAALEKGMRQKTAHTTDLAEAFMDELHRVLVAVHKLLDDAEARPG